MRRRSGAAPPRVGLRFAVVFPLLAGATLWAFANLAPALALRARALDGIVSAATVLLPVAGYPVHRDARDARVLRAEDGHGVRLAEECDGLVPTVLLLAAAVVSPVPWRRRLGFMAGGSAALFAINQARIGHLLWLSQADPGAFRAAHEAWWPATLVLCAGGMFLLWARSSVRAP